MATRPWNLYDWTKLNASTCTIQIPGQRILLAIQAHSIALPTQKQGFRIDSTGRAVWNILKAEVSQHLSSFKFFDLKLQHLLKRASPQSYKNTQLQETNLDVNMPLLLTSACTEAMVPFAWPVSAHLTHCVITLISLACSIAVCYNWIQYNRY